MAILVLVGDSYQRWIANTYSGCRHRDLSLHVITKFLLQTTVSQREHIEHCGIVVSAPAWDGTGSEFDSWQCQIYPTFIEPTITWIPSGFSGYIWLDTKIVLEKKKIHSIRIQLFYKPVQMSSSWYHPIRLPKSLSNAVFVTATNFSVPIL